MSFGLLFALVLAVSVFLIALLSFVCSLRRSDGGTLIAVILGAIFWVVLLCLFGPFIVPLYLLFGVDRS
jgi:riboflavin transporter FmnP